jgi:hypothetical protein
MPRSHPVLNPTADVLWDLCKSTLDVTRPAPSRLLALWLNLPLRIETPQGPILNRSSLEANLADCRDLTKRDPKTGAGLPGQSSGSWLGAIGYLVLLDQIGGAVRNLQPRRTLTGSSGFERALADFTEKTDDEAICLYALRNSLAHHYSLVNVPPPWVSAARRPGLTRLFTLTRGAPALIDWPASGWRLSKPNGVDATTVDVTLLGDLVEEAVREMR